MPKPKQAKDTADRSLSAVALPQPKPNPLVLPFFNKVPTYPGPVYQTTTGPNIIIDDEFIAIVFCFGAFADKITGVMYNDLTGNVPFMSLDGSVFFLVFYHYKNNAILATPIANLDDKSVFEVYKTHFKMVEAKGCKPKVNLMDNQATKYIKQFLTKKECQLHLVEPHIHQVNAAECTIQTFKDAFISTLATTDTAFPLQLRDKLAPQVQDTLNLLRA